MTFSLHQGGVVDHVKSDKTHTQSSKYTPKYLNEFTTASARGLFDYDLNDRTRNNGAKLIVKHFNTSVAQHFYQIKITTTWNALQSKVVSSRTVNSFKNSLDKHWAENPPNVRVNW